LIWFLRLFPAYVALEAELRANGERRILLEDQVRRLTAELEKATERADAAQRDHISTLKERTAMPHEAVTDTSMRPLGRQGRTVVAEGYAKYIRDAQKQFEEAIANREN
jgi:hypothetical protein